MGCRKAGPDLPVGSCLRPTLESFDPEGVSNPNVSGRLELLKTGECPGLDRPLCRLLFEVLSENFPALFAFRLDLFLGGGDNSNGCSGTVNDDRADEVVWPSPPTKAGISSSSSIQSSSSPILSDWRPVKTSRKFVE